MQKGSELQLAIITTIDTPLVLDLAVNRGYHKVYAMQLDNNTRKLIISLENNGEPYIIPSGVTVKLQGHRPDGAIIFKDCQIINNQIHCVLTSYELAVQGDCELNVTLYEGNPTFLETFTANRISSFSFKVAVPRNPLNEDTIVNSKEFSLLADTIKKLEEALDRTEEVLEDASELMEENQRLNDELNQNLDNIKDGLNDLRDGLDDLNNGLNDLHEGLDDLNNGLNDLHEGLDDLNNGLNDINDALSKANQATQNANDAADRANEAADRIEDLIVEELSGNYVSKSEVGVPNGVASLDENGKVPLEQLPEGIGEEFEKAWFVGTRAELDAALARGELEEGTKVFVTDDYETTNIPTIVSQAEYDALSESEKQDIVYFIYDSEEDNNNNCNCMETIIISQEDYDKLTDDEKKDNIYYIFDSEEDSGNNCDCMDTIIISQEDYDKLTEEEKEGNIYYIYDSEEDNGGNCNCMDTIIISKEEYDKLTDEEKDGNIYYIYDSEESNNCNCSCMNNEMENITLLSSSWTGSEIPYIYDLGIEDDYDFEISLSNTITADEVEALQSAQILGNSNDNLLRAWGDKPIIDIPVIIKKWATT